MKQGTGSLRISGCLSLLMVLAGCGGPGNQDLHRFVRGAHGVQQSPPPPIPQVQPAPGVVYDAFNLRDPFQPPAPTRAARLADSDRPREPLESYPLENLRMVGTVHRDGRTYALVKAPDNLVYRVGSGNHMGTQFGEVRAVTETTIALREFVDDGTGRLVERMSRLELQRG